MDGQSPFQDSLRVALVAVQALRDAGIDETDPDFEELVASECDALERLRKVLRAARWADGQAKALKDIEAEMRERRQRFEAKTETLRSIVKTALMSLDMTKLDAPDFSVSISAGKPKLVITDEAEIPSQLTKVVRTPDKDAIKKALEDGETIPGAELGAASPIMTVRTK